jgi:hypothetical protein
MYELIEARTRLYPKLARLHGKLSLIASQVNRTFYLTPFTIDMTNALKYCC